jgi:phosphoribosylanthranilate isomerase
MTTRVKVCGITRPEDAELSVRLGAAALGFNFYPRSPRSIGPRAARGIIEGLPPFVTAVGVYADEADAEHVIVVAQEAGVRILQFHGPRLPDLDGPLAAYSIIRAVAVSEGFEVKSLAGLRAQAFLLDAFHPELKGGTGKTFDWALARKATEYGTIILAGGLNPENVGKAIAEVRPFAVDVASGVESSPGEKDPEKVRAFFAAVEQADRQF